ncbi:MAG TPA: M20/M25/M40 family metallo-hydrolase [Syntrophomonadaceae bacterium]|nr:M20/M25/M40 family metallo-hydrolase [Syntrophomonadaceae bacterium]
MVNEQRLVDLFISLVQTDSPSGREGGLRDLLKEIFAQRGLKAEEDQAGPQLGGQSGNLLVSIPGDDSVPALLFCAHMDTVEPGRGVRAVKGQDGCIRSSGDTILGSDDKAAIAAMIEAYDSLRENHITHPPLEFLFTVSEEQGLMGSKQYDFSALRAQLAFVLDDGHEPGSIVVRAPCQNEIEYIARGKAAHAGMSPETGINAIQAAAGALAAMACGRIDEETTCNFGTIEGGIARNIVPDVCRVKGESRSLEPAKLEALTADLIKVFTREVEKRGAQAEVQVKFLYPAINLDDKEEVIRLAWQASEDINLKAQLVNTGGGSDANIINGHGIPCANLGVGMQAVHTCQEYIRVKDLVDAARWLVAIAARAGSKSV